MNESHTQRGNADEVFDRRLGAVRQHLEDIAARGDLLPDRRQALLSEALEVLAETVEELQVASEELHQQNQELVAAHEELQRARRRYQDLFEFAPGGYVVTDMHAVIQQANRAFAQWVGLPAQLLEGKPLVLYIADGERSDFNRHVNALLDAEGDAQREWESRLTVQNADDIPVSVTVARDLDRESVLQGFWWLIRDIRQQKAAHEALVQAERQALIGRLASSLAHEIGNPLQTVVGCIGLSEEALQEDDTARAQDLLEIGREELLRAGNIVDRLRNVTRGSDPGDLVPTDLNALIDEVLTLTQKHVQTHYIDLVWEPDPELPELPIVPDRIRQVFLNLVLNAIEAMGEGGRLEVCSTRRDHQVCVSVRDTGPGIPRDEQQKLFTPFHTTKAQGMGLGLYVTKQIVDEHDGCILVDTEVDRGTTFTVCLPVDVAAAP